MASPLPPRVRQICRLSRSLDGSLHRFPSAAKVFEILLATRKGILWLDEATALIESEAAAEITPGKLASYFL